MRALGVITRVLGAPLAGPVRTAAADAIVVLGSPLLPDGRLSDVVAERVAAGVALFHAGVAPLVLLTGGRGPFAGPGIPEAEAMARAAREGGVPEAALVLELRSTNTSENASLSAPLLRARGVRRVIVVSQPFHLRRACLWFHRAGFVAHGHVITDGIQARAPRRALRWIMKEYVSLTRDLVLTRTPGTARPRR